MAPVATGRTAQDLWVVLTGRRSTRTFVRTGILEGLRDTLGDRVVPVALFDERRVDAFRPTLGERVISRDALQPSPASLWERLAVRADVRLDRQLGFYPLAIRHNLRYGFHLERMRPGHEAARLNTSLEGRLPRWDWIERAMKHWQFSPHRHAPRALLRRMRSECETLVVTNTQAPRVVPLLVAARRLGIPVVGYVASWDHSLGKGVVSPHLDRYVVQSEKMRDDLERYHGIPPARVNVTGWPETDVFARRRPREAYEALLREYGLDAFRPVVLFAANSSGETPYETALVRRLVDWWESSGMTDRAGLLVRPYPTDVDWRERFAPALERRNMHVQQATYADFESLVTLLQHVDCVVVNGGTIMLEAIVNDRPVVCVLFDEGAPSGEVWAALNVKGPHYRPLMQSRSFYRAERFEELVDGIERAVAAPGELARERSRAAREIVGEVDGRAAERVVETILDVVRGPKEVEHRERQRRRRAAALAYLGTRLLGRS